MAQLAGAVGSVGIGVNVSGGRLGGIGVGRQPIVATAYHPHRMVCAVAGLGDSGVNLVGY